MAPDAPKPQTRLGNTIKLVTLAVVAILGSAGVLSPDAAGDLEGPIDAAITAGTALYAAVRIRIPE